MTEYAIKIKNKYFNGYVYADIKSKGRYGGNTALGTTIQDGDIIDVVITDTIERTETKRSLANTISCIYGVEKLANEKVEIIPIKT